jgi:hypothetical protein
MRLFPQLCAALLTLVFLGAGVPGQALAACCTTVTPVHVYVPPPHVVIVPHTTYVHPVTPQVHTHISGNTLRSNRSSVTAPAVQTRRTHVVQPIIVNDQTAATSAGCKRQHGGDGCKKKEEEQTGWATVRRWLQLDKH